MVGNQTLGKFDLRTTDTGGAKIRVIHRPTGVAIGTFDKDGFHLAEYPNYELPADPDHGLVAFDTNRGVPAWWDRDHYEWPSFVDDVLTSPVTVSGDVEGTTRTTVWDPGINKDSLVAGRVYQIDLHGSFSMASSSDRFTVDLNLANNSVAGIQSQKANVTDAPWSVEITFTVREDGENGILTSHTRGIFNSNPDDAAGGVTTVDTTTITELSVDITLNAASAGNEVTLEQAHLKQMG